MIYNINYDTTNSSSNKVTVIIVRFLYAHLISTIKGF